MARRRFGLPDADEADVVYIRAHLGWPEEKPYPFVISNGGQAAVPHQNAGQFESQAAAL
jgi:protein-L-isoaspartate O-methyltransferase